MSKPVHGFQYFWRDHAASFCPQSKDTNFRPNFAVFVDGIEASKKVEACEARTTANEGISQKASSTVIFPNFLPNFRLEGGIWEDYKAPNCPKIWVLGACIDIWLARRFSPSYVWLFFLQQRFVQSYAANLLGDIFLNYLPSLSLGWSIWVSLIWSNSIF